jgi:predicted nicotinamide N-methyase
MRTFVLSHTKLTQLAFVPEIQLHLADEVVPVWEKSELEAPPFWAFAWAGGQGLARYLLDHAHLVKGKRVLDLACGSGLVAIAAARCGAASVLANDIDEYAEAATLLNAEVNGVEVPFVGKDLLESTSDAEVILAGDIFYSREMSLRMHAFLNRSSAELVLVGDPGRAYAPKEGFEVVAEYEVPVNRDVEDTSYKRTLILRKRI